MRRAAIAEELIAAFAERTGLTSRRPQRRYLWTDAFALTVIARLEDADLAAKLVHDVHHELGRHRQDDPRSGWISGLAERDGEAHPTSGGLRIGKPLPERAAGEPLNQDLEWERDGQYFHYLTKWAHALNQAARWRKEPRMHVWARELMVAAHRAFVYGPRGARRMVWKQSIDLSRALVPSMGHHDPIDGLITCLELDATATELGVSPSPNLAAAAADFGAMVDAPALATDDPLGIGGLLFDAGRLAQIDVRHELLRPALDGALAGVCSYVRQRARRLPAHARLAFRELGLAIGLAAIPLLPNLDATAAGGAARALVDYVPLRDEIETFWLDPANRRAPTWTDHQDISDVMLATSLVPEVFLYSQTPIEDVEAAATFGGSRGIHPR